VIAALEDALAAAGIARDGLTIVKHFVAGLDEQQVARGRDGGRIERAQLFDVLASELEGLAGVEVGVGPDESSKQDWRHYRRVDQDGTQVVFLGQPTGVIAAERAADQCCRRLPAGQQSFGGGDRCQGHG